MKKFFKATNDLQCHFSLRKMSVGLCSIMLGLFFSGINNSTTVKADTTLNTVQKVNRQEKVDDQLLETNKNKGSLIDNPVEDKDVDNNSINVSLETNKSTNEESNKFNKVDNANVTSAPIVKNNSESKANFQPNKNNTFDLSDFSISSDKNRSVDILQSKLMNYSLTSGWENHNGKMYYRNWDGSYLKNQWAAPTGTVHYFGREGYAVKNQWYTLPTSKTYYFDNEGHTVKNRWYVLPNSKTYYFDNDGHTVKNRWYTLPTTWKTYYFDNEGHTVKNRWYVLPNSKTYYFDNESHTVKNRWYTLPTTWKTYYFDNDGHTVKNRWYVLPNSKTYYFDNESHTVKNRWYTLPTTWKTYYFDNEGHTVKNRWYTLPTSKTYYFDENGHTVKNEWHTINNIKYYFKENGRPAKDEIRNIDGTNYVFGADGSHEHAVNIDYFDIDNCVLKIDTDSPNIYLTYKILDDDSLNDNLETISFLGSTYEDLRQYVGKNINVELSQLGHVIESKKFYVAPPTLQLSNLKIENDVLSGHASAGGDLYIVNNNQRYYMGTIDSYGADFSYGISFLNGTTDPNLEVEVDVNGSAEAISTLSVPDDLQRANVSNVTVSEDTISGYVDRTSTARLLTSGGFYIASQDIPVNGGTFIFNVEDYAGQTVTLQVVQNGDIVYSQDCEVPRKHALDSIILPEGYTLAALQEAQDDPYSIQSVAEKGEEENKFTSESLADDQENVDIYNLTSDQNEELSEFALKLINQAREQFGRPDWEYSERAQKLANDVANEYVNNNQSGWDGHYVDGLVRAAKNNGLNISGNEIEDISSTSGSYAYSTMTDLKSLIYDGVTRFLFSDYSGNSTPEFYHAADILSGHKEEYWNDETLNAEFAVSFTRVDGIATVHFISVGSGKNW